MGDSQLRARLGPLGEGAVLGERVFETLSDAIVEGRLAPGEHISDKEIAEALHISRTPAREALRHLSWLGLVEVLPNRFTRVSVVGHDTIAHTLEFAGMQAGVAIHLAMQRMDTEALQQAIHLVDRVIAASDVDDEAGVLIGARALMVFLTRQSGNPIFAEAMEAVNLLVTRNLRTARIVLGSPDARATSYRAMRAAMLAGDAGAAEQFFRRQYRATVALLSQERDHALPGDRGRHAGAQRNTDM